MKLMGASLGLAGLTGCLRWPEQKLAPYAHRPADRTPGQAVYYPTAMELGGIGQGLLVRSFDGRPIKVEGNPAHPLNQGATDAAAQASLLEMYDPDRSRGIIKKEKDQRAPSTWDAFAEWAKKQLGKDGSGFCVLSEASSSPSLLDMKARLLKAMPKVQWFEYEPLSDDNIREGLRRATGQPVRPVLELSQATVIVSLDADLFGGGHPLAIKHARDFAAGRRLDDSLAPDKAEMNRLYVAEAIYSITGACADHRQAVLPGTIAALAAHVADDLGLAVPASERSVLSAGESGFVARVVADLKAHPGQSLVVAGPWQPPEVHELVAAINDKLGNVGKAVVYYPDPQPERPAHMAALRALVKKMNAGEVHTLLILGGNPVYNAPADLSFAEALKKVPGSVHLALHDDETSQLCTWHLSRAHYLEAWGDVRAHDGTVSIAQPLIEPLFDGRSAIEVLSLLAADKEGIEGGGQAIVRRTMQSLVGAGFSEWTWKQALSDGVVADTAWRPVSSPRTDASAAAADVSAASKLAAATIEAGYTPTYDLVFFSDGKVHDGRFANNGWLQELPEAMTRLTWDNAALMSPETARKMGAQRDELVVIEADAGRTIEAPVFVLSGMAENVVALAVGYGRTAAGNIGNGVGQNAYALQTSQNAGWRSGVTVQPTGRTYSLATAQDHHTMDRVGKMAMQERIPQLVVEGTFNQYRQEPSLGIKPTGLPSIFDEHRFDGRVDGRAADEPLPKHQLHKWAMVIDLTACTGCGACVVACQAENNIPIVGKQQVIHGREMHWIRVDRYFRETPEAAVAVHQPVTCMHCENAPCESVCPAAATTHSEEGINMMTYNRCVGVRYCLNNCPYKVRRFNFFDYNRGTLANLYTPNLLRQPDSDLLKMQKNPEVTVRMRGVMEKCSYCIQRIEHARIAARREGNRPIREDEIQTACQQACPARAIVFGDLNDRESRVAKLHRQARAYGLLDGYLNTKPRTVYLAKVRNPEGDKA